MYNKKIYILSGSYCLCSSVFCLGKSDSPLAVSIEVRHLSHLLHDQSKRLKKMAHLNFFLEQSLLIHENSCSSVSYQFSNVFYKACKHVSTCFDIHGDNLSCHF